MGEIIVLTKENCQKCKNLKAFISKALKKDEQDKFNFVLMEEKEAEFNDLVDKYHVQSLPVLIKEGVAVNYTSNLLVKKMAQ